MDTEPKLRGHDDDLRRGDLSPDLGRIVDGIAEHFTVPH
jgi:hypothetical protein